MRSHILCLVLRVLTSTVWAMPDFPFPSQPKPLHEVFQVDTRPDWHHNPSSCAKPMPRDPGNYGGHFIGIKMYDRTKAYEDREDNVLNNVWWQANTMMKYARAALLGDSWYRIPQIHSIVFSYFGIYPGEAPDYEPDHDELILLNILRGMLRTWATI